MSPDQAFAAPTRALLISAALVIVIAGVYAASSVLGPFLLAVFIAVVAKPPLQWMKRFGWPTWAGVALVTFVLLDIGGMLMLAGSGALEGFRSSLPGYQEQLVMRGSQIAGWLEALGVQTAREIVPNMFSPADIIGLTRTLLTSLSGIAAQGLLIVITVAFILIEAPTLPAKLKLAFSTTKQTDVRFQQLFAAINHYMLIKTATSLGTAACALALLTLLGIDFSVLWAILAFFLNFIPFVGSVLMAVPPILVALVQTDLQTTLLVVLGYLAINTAIGSILEPRIMGRGLGLSTLAVFLGLLFWGLVLGTIGMFLSVPLTMAIKVALDSSPHTRPIAIVLGPAVTEAADREAVAESVPTQAPAHERKAPPRQDREAAQQGE